MQSFLVCVSLSCFLLIWSCSLPLILSPVGWQHQLMMQWNVRYLWEDEIRELRAISLSLPLLLIIFFPLSPRFLFLFHSFISPSLLFPFLPSCYSFPSLCLANPLKCWFFLNHINTGIIFELLNLNGAGIDLASFCQVKTVCLKRN